jgi:hypothetical protein
MSRKTYTIALGLAGVLSVGSLGASKAAAFPINAAALKAAAPISITDVRGGYRGGGARVGGYHGGGARAGGYHGGAYRAGGYRAGGYGYRGGAYGYRGGGYGWRAPYWGAAAGAAAVGAAAAGAAATYGNQCGYYPYPACY